MLRNRVALIGGGHANALVLRKWAMHPTPQTELVLISPVDQAAYSGMLPGLIAGHYDVPSMHIDLRRLAQSAGANFIQGRVEGIDPHTRQIFIDSRPPLVFDVASINVGSIPAHPIPSTTGADAIPVKPVERFLAHWNQVVLKCQDSTHTIDIILVGGGAGGVELALAMAYRLGPKARLTIVHAGKALLANQNRRAQQLLHTELKSKRITVILEDHATAIDANALHLGSGRTLTFDALYWATHATAPEWFKNSNLPLNETGFLVVDNTLSCQGLSGIFAAGDCATMIAQPRPKAGVFAVRQATPLYQNLRNTLDGRPLIPVRLQQNYLSLIALGEKNAVASRSWLAVKGSWAWRWKDHIDRTFMRQFSTLDPTPAMMPSTNPEPMRCFGCGSKIGAQALAEALDLLTQDFPEIMTAKDILWGIPDREDVSLWSITNPTKLFQSIDYLPALITDPFIAGQITANHVANDILVKGGQFHSALVLAILPISSLHLSRDNLRQLLAGIATQLKLMGTRLIGGHTAEGERLAIGMAANGLCLGSPIRKTTGKPDDVLILTKALGTGVIFAGLQKGLANAPAVKEAIDSMLISHHTVHSVLTGLPIHAATDVTGFGFLGHLKEMLSSGDLAATVESHAIPYLRDAQKLAEQGVSSSLFPSNQAAVQAAVSCREPGDWQLWCDPQTSGGWLLSIAPDDADLALAKLRQAGLQHASIIGRLTHYTPSRPLITII